MLRLPSLRNSFAAPLGFSPGFNQAHLASNGMLGAGNGFSGVAVNGNMINLLSGLVGTVRGAPIRANLGMIGECVGFGITSPSTATDCLTYSGQQQSQTPNFTIAAIVQAKTGATGTTNNNDAIFTTSGSSQEYGFYYSFGATQGLFIGKYGGGVTSGGNQAPNNIPAFVLVSNLGATSTNFFAMRLDTGVWMFYNTSGCNQQSGNTDGTYAVGNGGFVDGSGSDKQSICGYIASAMFNPSLYLTQSQILSWAQDPWSFWYPGASAEIWADDNIVKASVPPVINSTRRNWITRRGLG